MKMHRGKITLVTLAVLAAAELFGGTAQANDANNWGALQVDIRLEGKQLNNSAYIVKHDVYYPGATDGIDPPQGSTQYDVELLLFRPNRSGAFVDVENKKLDQEVSANSSRTAKHVKGIYNGTIAEMDYSGPDFASIPFGKLPAGTYTPDTPFLHLRVDFEKLIADSNNDIEVNLKDYAIMAKYFGQEGRCIADISGPNDIPDKIVNLYDLAAFTNDYLK